MKRKASFLVIIAVYTFLLIPMSPLLAEESNTISSNTPSKVHHEPRQLPAVAGKPLMIEATVKEEVVVQRVTIYYRTKGSEKYENQAMKRDGKSYKAEIPGDAVGLPAIEYYILVVDLAGEFESSRSAQSPFVLPVIDNPEGKLKAESTPSGESGPTIVDSSLTPNGGLSTPPISPAWYSKWWVWTIVGAVATGTAIAFSSKKGDDSNDRETPAGPGPVTVTGPIP